MKRSQTMADTFRTMKSIDRRQLQSLANLFDVEGLEMASAGGSDMSSDDEMNDAIQ